MVDRAQIAEIERFNNELAALESGLKVLEPANAVVVNVSVGGPDTVMQVVPTLYAEWLQQQMRQVLRSGLWHRANEVINQLQNLGVTGLTYLPPPA
jgi:hypothetical protein